METGSYDHFTWSVPRLTHRLYEIAYHLDTIKLSQERIHQLDLEADCISFELGSRDLGDKALTLFDIQEGA